MRTGTGGAIATLSLAALLLLPLHFGMQCNPRPLSGMATAAAAEDDVQQYTDGLGMWVCTVYARPGPIDKATCDWMCRLSNNSTAGGLLVRLGGDYECCKMGCHCSFCVSVYTIGAGHGMCAAAALWPTAICSVLVLVVMLLV